MKIKTRTFAAVLALLAPAAFAHSQGTPPPATQAPAQDKPLANEPAPNTTKEERPDAWILTKIKSKFAVAKDLEATKIHVDVVNGVVALHGTVKSPKEVQIAKDLALETVGVKQVDTSGLLVDTGKPYP